MQQVCLRTAAALPTKLYVELTTECNLDCRMCMRQSWDEPGGRMPPALFYKLLDQIAAMPGPMTINFSGFGEPTCHPHFLDFLARAKQAGLRAELVTNGILLRGTPAEGLLDHGLDRLIVSVDGLGRNHDEMRRGGSVADVLENLRAFNRLRTARKAQRPEIGLEFVATKRNIHELPALRRLSPLLGFSSILVTNLIPYTPDLQEEILYERWTMMAAQTRPSVRSPSVDLPLTDDCSGTAEVIKHLQDISAPVRLRGVDYPNANRVCPFIAESRLAIAWDGAVSPCLPLMHSHTYYFRGRPKRIRAYRPGYVSQTSLTEIWDSQEYRAFRERVRSFDFAPCIDCLSCDRRDTNEQDCRGDEFPRCGECLWAAGLIQCP